MYFFKQKTAYERRIRDWSSVVCSSDLTPLPETHRQLDALDEAIALSRNQLAALAGKGPGDGARLQRPTLVLGVPLKLPSALPAELLGQRPDVVAGRWQVAAPARGIDVARAGFYPHVAMCGRIGRPERRRGGKGCVSPCRARWATDIITNTTKTYKITKAT